MKKFKKILVPTDFSEAAERALEYAFTFASAMDLDILLLHVIDGGPVQAMLYAHEMLKQEYLDRMSHEDMAKEAKRVLEKEKQKGVTYDRKLNVTTHVREGVPYDQIVKVAKDKGVDFIVMGARGVTALEEMFIGGVAEKVSRRAPCPVFLVRRRRKG